MTAFCKKPNQLDLIILFSSSFTLMMDLEIWNIFNNNLKKIKRKFSLCLNYSAFLYFLIS